MPVFASFPGNKTGPPLHSLNIPRPIWQKARAGHVDWLKCGKCKIKCRHCIFLKLTKGWDQCFIQWRFTALVESDTFPEGHLSTWSQVIRLNMARLNGLNCSSLVVMN